MVRRSICKFSREMLSPYFGGWSGGGGLNFLHAGYHYVGELRIFNHR